jgi:hypothetical protein
MVQNITVIGCGTVGSNLCIELAKNKVKDLKIYDFDIITSQFYPFTKDQIKIFKVDIVKFLVKKESNNSTKVSVFKKNISEPINDNSFIIDCRDKKETYINSNIEISLDGTFLHINSEDKFNKNIKRSVLYNFTKNLYFINKGIKTIIQYLKNHEYKHKEFRIYNLEKDDEYEILLGV